MSPPSGKGNNTVPGRVSTTALFSGTVPAPCRGEGLTEDDSLTIVTMSDNLMYPMDGGKKQRLWEELHDYQEELIVKRFITTIEHCLVDLGVTASPEELRTIRLLSHDLAKSSVLNRAIGNSCREIWNTIYADHYGTITGADRAESSSSSVSDHSGQRWARIRKNPARNL